MVEPNSVALPLWGAGTPRAPFAKGEDRNAEGALSGGPCQSGSAWVLGARLWPSRTPSSISVFFSGAAGRRRTGPPGGCPGGAAGQREPRPTKEITFCSSVGAREIDRELEVCIASRCQYPCCIWKALELYRREPPDSASPIERRKCAFGG